MTKYLAIIAVALTLGIAAKPAQASPALAHTSGMPWGAKAMLVAMGLVTTSVILNAMIVNQQQRRPLTVEEAHYAILLPFLWVVRPVAPPPPMKKGRR